MHIDVHAHHFPVDYIELVREKGGQYSESARTLPGAQLPLDERVDMLADVGIDLQVLSVSQHQPYLEREADAVDAARMANDIYADVCRGHKGRFKAFVAVPLPHVEAALAELERGLDTLAFLGVTLGCSINGRPLDEPSFEPFWAELDRRGTVVFLHPVGLGVLEGEDKYGLTWMIGAPVEDTVAALRLVLSGITSRYPRIRFIVPHLGGILPFLAQRIENSGSIGQSLGRMTGQSGSPREHFRRLWYDTVNSHPEALACTCGSFGADRVLLGTDFPYLYGPKLKRCLTYVEDAGLSAAEVEGILGGNAEALLGLGARA
ncbi:MAG TPA: amidohydrolase family protein [Chloroflexota bacterium]|jgi:aminocarboxymuconate-semialdehyde decarboxylase